MTFTIAIVGRPNVGKSTLFNRLVGQRLALVDNRPGVTRDRRQGEGRLGELKFTVMDTAGYEDVRDNSLEARMRRQSEAAIADADLCLLVIDARTGLVPADKAFAALVRASGKPVVLVANKAEGRAAETGILESYALGLGDPIAISAEHGTGMADLYQVIAAAIAGAAALPAAGDTGDSGDSGDTGDSGGPETEGDADGPPGRQKPIRIAIVGRPNAGKSTLINKMIGQERLLTGPEAGITRDAISVDWTWRDGSFRLFDTAGLRRKARVRDKLEKLSVADALRAIRFAEVVILVLDVSAPLEKQDLQIADLVAEEGRALVLALNKWDLATGGDARLKEIRADLAETLQQVRGVALVPVSALTGQGLDRLMQTVMAAHDTWNRRLPTAGLNRWLAEMVARHPPPAASGRRIRLKYVSQTATRPPTFYLACSRPDALPDAYRRYLVNSLRETFDLQGVPIRLMLRKRQNPYASRGRKAG